MQDLTEGSINRHLIMMSIPMAIGMAVQVLYNLIDIYFVAQIGEAAVAGVSAAGNVLYAVMALTHILSVGAIALISRAAGSKDRTLASLVFNQTLLVSIAVGLLVWLAGTLGAGQFMNTFGADAATIAAGRTYLYWFVPSLALQFAIISMSVALRSIGIVRPTMLIQVLSVFINAILAPILIAGWLTGKPMGVAGAGLASSLAVLASLIMLTWYFARHSHYVRFDFAQCKPDFKIIKRIIGIGLPVGGEFFLMFVYLLVVYWVIKDFGSAAQAGFGIGMRVMQSFFLPVMALSFAMPAIIGQNLGANLPARIRETLFKAVVIECVLMTLVMLVCKWHPDTLIAIFSKDSGVILFGADFLSIISWNFVGMGVIFACSGYFQGVGNTWPALLSTATRILLFVFPAIWLSHRVDFKIEHLWYLSVATVIVQMFLSLALAKRSLRRFAPLN